MVSACTQRLAKHSALQKVRKNALACVCNYYCIEKNTNKILSSHCCNCINAQKVTRIITTTVFYQMHKASISAMESQSVLQLCKELASVQI